MNLILWIVFAACLAHQANADYRVQISSMKSNNVAVTVSKDNPKKGDIKVTNHKERPSGGTFKANVYQESVWFKGEVEGEVCNVSTETADGLIAKIFHEALGVEGCPFPEGEIQVKTKFNVEGNALDKLLPPGFGDATIEAKVYSADNDGSGKEDTLWYIEIFEIFENDGKKENEESKK